MPRPRTRAAAPEDLNGQISSAWDQVAASDAAPTRPAKKRPVPKAAPDPDDDDTNTDTDDDPDDDDAGDDDGDNDDDDTGGGDAKSDAAPADPVRDGAVAVTVGRVMPFARKLGVAPADLISQWADLHQKMLNDPRATVAWIAAQHGVPMGGGAPAPAPAQPAVPVPPELAVHLDPVRREVQMLRQSLAARDQKEAADREAQNRAAMDRFAADPANTHFPQVRDAMAKLIQAGLAGDLPDAYDKACAMDPVVRSQRQAEQTAAADADKRARAKRKAAAGSGISGTPGTAGTAPPASVRDALMAAWDDQ